MWTPPANVTDLSLVSISLPCDLSAKGNAKIFQSILTCFSGTSSLPLQHLSWESFSLFNLQNSFFCSLIKLNFTQRVWTSQKPIQTNFPPPTISNPQVFEKRINKTSCAHTVKISVLQTSTTFQIKPPTFQPFLLIRTNSSRQKFVATKKIFAKQKTSICTSYSSLSRFRNGSKHSLHYTNFNQNFFKNQIPNQKYFIPF